MNIYAQSFIILLCILVSNFFMYFFAYHDAQKKLVSNLIKERYFEHEEELYAIKKLYLDGCVYSKRTQTDTEHA